MKKISCCIAVLFSSLVHNAQNVGIGTINPTEQLDVNGNINVTGTIKTNGTDGLPNQVLMKNNNGTLVWADISEFKNFKSFTNTTSTTWTVPDGVSRLLIEAWGAGGGGAVGGGGGSGGYVIVRTTIVAGTTVTVTCGIGGSGASSSATTGTLGGTTFVSFTGGSLSAQGGRGAQPTVGGTGAVMGTAGTGDHVQWIGYEGETGISSWENYGQYSSTVFYTAVHYGNGANAPFAKSNGGSGGFYSYNTASLATIKSYVSTSGRKPGGGGGGGGSNSGSFYGSPGADGMVIIRW